MRGRMKFVALGAVVAAAVPPAAVASAPGRTEKISVPVTTEGLGFGSFRPALSADGRSVAFDSGSENLVPHDTNGKADVFVRDRVTGSTERVSVNAKGAPGDGPSSDPAISSDARYVAFVSSATNLLPAAADGNFHPDVYVRDRVAGTIERASVGNAGQEGTAPSDSPSISADGRFVVFQSFANNLVPVDTNGSAGSWNVFVRDRTAGTTTMVDVTPTGAPGSTIAIDPSITPDGRWVVFLSSSTNLVAGDTNGEPDVFVRDLHAGVTERVSVADDGTQANEGSLFSEGSPPTISDDGRYVAFASAATNLVPNDTNGVADIFVRDRVAGVTRRVSVTSAGAEADANSIRPAISGDGRWVAFRSAAALVPEDRNRVVGGIVPAILGGFDVYLHDLRSGITERASVGADGAELAASSERPSLSRDGRYVGFETGDHHVVPGEEDDEFIDVFVRDRGPAIGVGGLAATRAGATIDASGWVRLGGVSLAGVADPRGDALAPALGTEIVGAEISWRPEAGELSLRVALDGMPGIRVSPGRSSPGTIPSHSGLPGVVIGAAFRVGADRFEVRASRWGTVGPTFELYRCASGSCAFAASLAGGFGTAGEDVSVSVPAPAIGGVEGTPLDDVRAFARLTAGDIDADAAVLGTVTIPAVSVDFGAAPAGADASAVAFDHPGTIAGGAVSASFDAALPPGIDVEVWARTCVGGVCHAASFATG